MANLQHSNGRRVNVPDDSVDYYLDKGWTRVGAQPAPKGYPDGTPDDSWKNDEIEAYAAAKSIDLGSAKKKADMLAAIKGVNGGTDADQSGTVPATADGGAANPS